MPVAIRPALAEDAQAIAAIGRRSFTWAFGHLYQAEALARYLEATYAVGKISGSLRKDSNLYFVAEREGRIEGFLKLKAASPRGEAREGLAEWQVQKLYIDPERIQGGLGRELMAAGEALMAARGVGSAWLLVYTGNERALRFYRALGYLEVDTRTLGFEGMSVEFMVMEKAFELGAG
jgi:ribosomal protein S18 acetylase RimI-like enzyme